MRSLYIAVFVFCLALVAGILGLTNFFTGKAGSVVKVAPAAVGARQGAEPATLQAALLALMGSPQQEVRLGAMLLSVHAADPEGAMAAFIRKSQSPEDGPLPRTVKNYALAYMRASAEDSLRFIREFPDDPNGFPEVLRFDGRVMGHAVGGVMVELFAEMTSCRETDTKVREAARSRLPSLRAAQTAAGYAAEVLPGELEVCK